MPKRKLPIFLIVILVLAFIGLFVKLLLEPKNLFFSILITVGVIAVFLLVISLVNRRSNGPVNDETRKYNQALKQSQKKYKSTHTKGNPNFLATTKRAKRRKRSHLTVIEGNKFNNKNQIER